MKRPICVLESKKEQNDLMKSSDFKICPLLEVLFKWFVKKMNAQQTLTAYLTDF
jgi:hypothetical protein